MNNKAASVKRFYENVLVDIENDQYKVLLDNRVIKTAAGQPLMVRKRRLADAIRDEWSSQVEEIDRPAMTMTNLACGAIDAGAEGAKLARDEMLNYLQTDLLCYRADMPAALVSRQEEVWDPYIGWIESAFGTRPKVTQGIQAIGQPIELINIITSHFDKIEPDILLAMQRVVSIAGSAMLGLALWHSVRSPSEIFEASRVDEAFQIERWGEDAEASARTDGIRNEFLALANYIDLLRDDSE